MFDSCYLRTYVRCQTYPHIHSAGRITIHRPARRASYPQAGRRPPRGVSGQIRIPRTLMTEGARTRSRQKSTELSTGSCRFRGRYPQDFEVIHRLSTTEHMFDLWTNLWTNLWITPGGLWKSRAWLSTGCGFPVDNRSARLVLVTRCDTGRASRACPQPVEILWTALPIGCGLSHGGPPSHGVTRGTHTPVRPNRKDSNAYTHN